ncbi:hypothetical protein TcYC6_0000240 [Trypanosoma cruzi]|nr:hypothetical protein TcYC6_0000240 [Trypanosoma cruzi]
MFAATPGLRVWDAVKSRGRSLCRSRSDIVMVTSTALCVSTYCMMANWIYGGYVDLWYGVYGLDDDDDDEDAA